MLAKIRQPMWHPGLFWTCAVLQILSTLGELALAIVSLANYGYHLNENHEQLLPMYVSPYDPLYIMSQDLFLSGTDMHFQFALRRSQESKYVKWIAD